MVPYYNSYYTSHGTSATISEELLSSSTLTNSHTHNYGIYIDNPYICMNFEGRDLEVCNDWNKVVNIGKFILNNKSPKKMVVKGDITFTGNIDVDLKLVRNPNLHGMGIISTVSINDKIFRQCRTFFEESLYSSSNNLKDIFLEYVKDSAKITGRRIARDIIEGRLSREVGNLMTATEAQEKILNNDIKIKTKVGSFKIPLKNLIKSCDIENADGVLEFDYEKLRIERKQFEKGIYTKKLQSINIIKSITKAKLSLDDAYKFWGIKNKNDFSKYNEEDTQKEIKALQLLRRLVQEDKFAQYIKEQYIDIPAIKGNKIYRIHRDKKVEVINIFDNKIESRLCIHANCLGAPKTDEVIAKMLLAKSDKLIEKSNVYPVCNDVIA